MTPRFLRLGGLLACWLCSITVFSQTTPGLRINEFLASNVTVFPDNADFEDYSDWIELFNGTDSEISLDQYYLTDNPAFPTKWAFPADSKIPANGHFIIRADGFNAGPGETFVREFSPWSTFTTRYYHAPFKLAAEGESIHLFHFEGISEDLPLVTLGSDWQYWDQGTDPGPDWMSVPYDASNWPSGPAQLGYGENDQATVLSFGGDSQNKFPAYYFRKTFTLNSLEGLNFFEIKALVDDGAILYINGQEVERLRMPDTSVDHLTYATSTSSENVFDTIVVPSNYFVEGENLLAVEVHQVSRNSSDLSFDLQLFVHIAQGEVTLQDEVTFGQQYPDISFGRNPEQENEWVFFGEPTPGSANFTYPASTPVYTTPVTLSPASGFFDQPVEVEIHSDSPEAEIHYTLDGSIPGSFSPLYTSPITLIASAVVRARAFEPNRLPSPVQTQTYLIGEPTSTLPVVSIAVDPEIFFQNPKGIYNNVHKGREAPLHIDFFDAQQNLGFAVNAGAKIAGENIWRFAQKPLTITTRGKYGDDVVNYQIFPKERTGVFGQFVLRNGGDNWQNAMLRDAMTPFILRGQSNNEVQNYRPCASYINGQYWGIYNIREKLDPVSFATQFHINSGDYDYLEYGHVIGNVVALIVAEGSDEQYLATEAYALANDLSDDAHYAIIESQVDAESFIDYASIQDFVYNSSWRHNREFWKEKRAGAKWRFVIADLDRGFNINNISSALIDNLKAEYPLFGAMTKNLAFRNRLAQRYAAHLGSTFHPGRIADIVDQLDTEVLPEVQRHIDRWKSAGGIQSLSSRQNELDEIKEFAQRRTEVVYAYLKTHLNLGDTADLSFNLSPNNGGSVRVHGVPLLPQYSSTSRLWKDLPVELEAEPAPGFAFVGWDDGTFESSDPQITLTLNEDRSITARFEPIQETVLSGNISVDTTLTVENSPFIVQGSVQIEPNITLTVEPGVEFRFMPQADLIVQGALVLDGTANNPILLHPRFPSQPWGSISFVNATGISRLSHIHVRGGTLGPDPVNLKSTISNFHSILEMDHVDIDVPATIFARGGRTVLLSSRIHSPYTGDGINVKNGEGRVEDCVFFGNNAPDTDAIDFDGVTNGIIRNNRILAFQGPNSDGIDIGEGCVNLLLEGNLIYNNSDKGVSVGQGSEVIMRRNLIVGCVLGVGIKDLGSIAYIDQNTFAQNTVAVAVYEKNLLDGGGNAVISNTLFSRSKEAPFTTDALSTLSVNYSLSDTLPLPGIGNLLADPEFTHPDSYDFSLQPTSPAINSGDPDHPLDPDQTRADIGAAYVYSPDHYPYHVPNSIVINEILSHSNNDAPDWIELHNSGSEPVDIGGWFLSDDPNLKEKYQIAPQTILPANGYLVFHEDLHFGANSPDPGALIPFALSQNGESIVLYGPGEGLILDYTETESFGPSAPGVTKGRHFKPSTQTYNFVALSSPTPGAPNSSPLVGPIVISEIMYHPQANGEAEYLELLNISSVPVTLFDNNQARPWSFTAGIEFAFPSDPPVSIQPGERILLVRNLTAFRQSYAISDSIQVFQWTNGALNNQGERLELSSPGITDETLTPFFIRQDRVNFEDSNLWPLQADGLGASLTRIDVRAYGNDVANWVASDPTPGTGNDDENPQTYSGWAKRNEIPSNLSAPFDDADNDGVWNFFEYIHHTSPMAPTPQPTPTVLPLNQSLKITYRIASGLQDVGFAIQYRASLSEGEWTELPSITVEATEADESLLIAETPQGSTAGFFRLKVSP